MVAGIKLPKWIGNGWKKNHKKTNKNKVNKQKLKKKKSHFNTSKSPPVL